MRLLEYQAKELLAQRGVPAPSGQVAATPEAAREVAARLGRVVVKAQVSVGGRGKAGGIKLAETPAEAEAAARALLGSTLKGLPVRQVLVEQALEIARELYLSVALDRAQRCLVLISCAEGGVDIEEVGRLRPASLARIPLDPFVGLRGHHIRQAAHAAHLPAELGAAFAGLAEGLYRCLHECDATLAEINPLALTVDGRLVAADAKIVVDDNALYRQPELAAWGQEGEEPYQALAREQGLSYIKLTGEIGCMVNGAGLAMATMDITRLYGSAPANFADIGGGARAERVLAALRIILADPQVRAVLINIFGGITRCDEVAEGIVAALRELRPRVPIVARLVGTNQEEGQRILGQAQVLTAHSLSEAARLAVSLARPAGGQP
ncbi:MAG: ADP-forming succinate--CoA ligase subunit beta [Chloroflexi bacterium]|mgnify:CR=1 FL=1|nr:ADP-forming succinate--CoA ligase subunit beta [Chloroflexota bacterium]